MKNLLPRKDVSGNKLTDQATRKRNRTENGRVTRKMLETGPKKKNRSSKGSRRRNLYQPRVLYGKTR